MQNTKQGNYQLFRKTYPSCCKILTENKFNHLAARAGSLELFADVIMEDSAELQLPAYLGELARLEFAVSVLKTDSTPVPLYTEKPEVNPTLQLFENSWKNLYSLVDETATGVEPVFGQESIIIWKHPASGIIQTKAATDEVLLVLKMALEKLSARDIARQGNIHAAAVEVAVIRALDEGLITGPKPGIKRDFPETAYQDIDPAFFSARIFTLQWHITQACDLHCRHCYDRGHYKALSLPQEIAILDDFTEFCASHNVHGQVTFTGGNPLLHPHFEKLYEETSQRGLSIAILGNPASREQLERLTAIQPLAFYQVSLEGLEEHNDYMRGEGHFKRVLAFLDLLREMKIYSMVMLTLTKANMEQVIPLAEILRNRVDLFTFNRLSLVGEGANLITVDPERFPDFLKAYSAEVESNPCLGIKDNLLNIIFHEQQKSLFGGCTGYGCGAAFNFMAVLADGAVHACRKFPSHLGSLMDQSLTEIYDSAAAKRYRNGAEECRDCMLNPVCRGCLAVAYSHGLDIFARKDPYCFLKS